MEEFNQDGFEESEFGLAKKELDPRLGYVFKLETMPVKGSVRSFRIKCFDKEGVIAGSTHIYQYPDHLKAAEVLVGRYHRRQGIASAMYKQAERYTGLKMKPSGVTTQDGKALWGSMDSETLGKSLKGAVAGLAMGLASVIPGSTSSTDGDAAPDFSVKDTPLNQAPEELHPHLSVISHLESSGGRNTAHKKGHSDYWTAHGDLGIKPAFGHDEYKRNPELQKRFPGLRDPRVFSEALKTYPAVYNAIANSAWNRYLKKFNGDLQRAAYAWHEGEYAELRDRRLKRPQAYKKHPYVRNFVKLIPPDMAMNTEPMSKSLANLEAPQGEDGRYDYSHILPEELRQKGYRIRIDDGVDQNGLVEIEAILKHHDPEQNLFPDNPEWIIDAGHHPGTHNDASLCIPDASITPQMRYRADGPGHYVGVLGGKMGKNRKVGINLSHVYQGHRRQGLGTALYEAFLAHAHNKLGATHVSGGVHSTLSHEVHKKVAAKHGLSYEADRTGERKDPPPNDDAGSFDDAFDGYEYKLR